MSFYNLGQVRMPFLQFRPCHNVIPFKSSHVFFLQFRPGHVFPQFMPDHKVFLQLRPRHSVFFTI